MQTVADARRSSASTSSSARSIYRRRATRWASTTRPDGDQYYRNRIKYYTTIDNPDAARIHNIGLEEVKRIRAEMEKTLEGINFLGTLDQFLSFIRNDPRFYYKTPDELFAAYEKTARGIEPQLPKLFGRLPKTTFGIRPIPAASAPTTTTAYYQPPSLDGSAPGQLLRESVQARDASDLGSGSADRARVRARPSPADRAGVRAAPACRNSAATPSYTAFVEGWALYSEKLGYELGLYKDDFSKMGQLNYDMWRAVRLVVDTGMHQFKWTRDQAIYYFKQNTGKNELDIDNEVDRYISWPGQALAYKLGQLKIQALRDEAEKALGDALRHPRLPRPAPRNGRVAACRCSSRRCGPGSRRRARGGNRRSMASASLVLQPVFERVDGAAAAARCGFPPRRAGAAPARACVRVMSSRFSSSSISKRARAAARLAAA